MEKPRGEIGGESGSLPPPYSSVVPSYSQEYNGVRPPVLASAPYPSTPESDQVPHHMMMIPPPYYFNPIPVGTSGTGGMPPSSNNPTYTPSALYNPTVTVNPTSQRSTHWGNAKTVSLRFFLMAIVVVVIITIGIGTNYFLKEVF